MNTFVLVLFKIWLYLSKNLVKFDYPHHVLEITPCADRIAKPAQWCHTHWKICMTSLCWLYRHIWYMALLFNYHTVRIIRFYDLNTAMFWIKPMDMRSIKLCLYHNYMKIFISMVLHWLGVSSILMRMGWDSQGVSSTLVLFFETPCYTGMALVKHRTDSWTSSLKDKILSLILHLLLNEPCGREVVWIWPIYLVSQKKSMV